MPCSSCWKYAEHLNLTAFASRDAGTPGRSPAPRPPTCFWGSPGELDRVPGGDDPPVWCGPLPVSGLPPLPLRLGSHAAFSERRWLLAERGSPPPRPEFWRLHGAPSRLAAVSVCLPQVSGCPDGRCTPRRGTVPRPHTRLAREQNGSPCQRESNPPKTQTRWPFDLAESLLGTHATDSAACA